MAEEIIHVIMLALHNIALVGCAAAPFYNRNLVLMRGQYGPKLHYELDKVVEDTIQGNAPYCMVFIAMLFATGVGIPLNHYFFAGSFRELHIVSSIAIVLKLVFVFGMVIIMFVIFFKINPRLSVLFGQFSAEVTPNEELENDFFELRGRRKALCDICLIFALGVLICSAFMGFAY